MSKFNVYESRKKELSSVDNKAQYSDLNLSVYNRRLLGLYNAMKILKIDNSLGLYVHYFSQYIAFPNNDKAKLDFFNSKKAVEYKVNIKPDIALFALLECFNDTYGNSNYMVKECLGFESYDDSISYMKSLFLNQSY